MHKSASLDSLNLRTTSTTSVLTSTANPDVKPSSFSKLTRRMATIPTPNRPVRLLTSAKIRSCINEDSSMLTTNVDTNKHLDSRDKSHALLGSKQNSSELLNIVDNRSNQEDQNKDEEDEDNETEALFNRFRVSRRLRFKAIPLLVQDEAKRKYIRYRRSIISFDNFYEFLLTNFDVTPPVSSTSKPSYVNPMPESAKSTVYVNTSVTELKSNVVSSTDFDSVITDLRKAIVADFIKNPKIFRGYKDDVTKWLEGIDHLMQIAHVPDSNRLDLISYSLRGDALQWFRNNKSTLTTFKNLEPYTQGENQSVRNFYNEVLKLCKQADASMSESTKLKNLLNKVKPSIQLEVRKKRPKSTTEFLEYAKEVEELLQLSNVSVDTNLNHDSKSKTSTKLVNTSTNFSSGHFRNSDSNINDPVSSSFKYYSSYVPKADRSQTTNSNAYSHSNRYTSLTNKSISNSDNRKQKSAVQLKNTPKHENKANSRLVNVAFPSTLSAHDDNINNSVSSIVCQICNQLGHDTSSCSTFQ
ncbi:unnamed protein product [Rotaria sp. Silwood2]|nr:unnamed protein product [Rotaria sp. Silwood2]